MKILLAEDDREMRLLLEKTLTREGYEVRGVVNGVEAINLLRTDTPVDLLVTDIRMPEIDGEQLLNEAKALRPNLKVILITSYHDRQQYRRLVEGGAFEFLLKPFKIPDLLDIIDRAMETA